MDFMEVSVIIPVYNAAPFVEKAVRSALMQEEVQEVLVIDDGSADGSWEILQGLAKEDSRVRLFRHPGGVNNGPGASRNIGLEKTQFEFISFLDADDFFVKDRFKNTEKVFLKHPEADGVYGTVMVRQVIKSNEHSRRRKYIRMECSSWNELFDNLCIGNKGYFSIVSLVMRKSFIKKVGFFDLELMQSEDTDFLLRCALAGKLFSEDSPLVLTIVNNHGSNITNNNAMVNYYRWMLHKKWLPYFLKNPRSKRTNIYFFRSLLDCHPIVRRFDGKNISRKMMKGIVLLFYFVKTPKMALLFL